MGLPLVSDILEQVEKTSSRKEKVKILQYHGKNPVLIEFCKYVFDDNIKFDLPEGDPPYETDKFVDENQSGLYQQLRKFYLFLEGGNPNLRPVQRERLFIELIESIHPKEAKLVLSVKDKKFPYKGITKKLIQEAYPGLV
jgi:hypothetical protein